MTGLDRETLAERAAAIERHLDRVAARLPASPDELRRGTDAADAVVLNLWQALQLTIDLAIAACLHFKLTAPGTYADAFRQLGDTGLLDHELADRLARAAGFRNLVVHGYQGLDLARVHAIARTGPADLRAFLATLRDRI